MAIVGALTNASLWLGKYAMQSSLNMIALDSEVDTQECTVYGASWKAYKPGLKGFGIQMSGYWDSTPDGALFTDHLGTESIISLAAETSVGSNGFCALADEAKYGLEGRIGQMFGFSVQAMGTGPLGRGMLMENSTRVSTANGTGQQLGALSAAQMMIANLHVTAKSGTPTLDVIVQSDDNAGFTTPTTRMTFSQMTDVGSLQRTVLGAVTDDYWRFVFTIGGGSPSLTIAGFLGIAAI